MSEAERQDISAFSPPRPFSTPEAGADYLATEAHSLSLAARIYEAIRRGRRFVFLAYDEPSDLERFNRALVSVASGQFAIIRIPCGPQFTPEQLLRSLPSGPGGPTPVPPRQQLFVFEAADQLSDAQFADVFRLVAPQGSAPFPAVILGNSQLLARLDRLRTDMSRNALAVKFYFRDLGREEIEPFIRSQLQNDTRVTAFTGEAIGAIADFSGGDPTLVNRLAKIMLENPDWTGKEQERERRAIVGPPLPALERRPQLFWKVAIGILLCSAASGWMVIGNFGRHDDLQIDIQTPTDISVNPSAPAEEHSPIVLTQEPPSEPPSADSETPREDADFHQNLPRGEANQASTTAKPAATLHPDEIAALLARGKAFLEVRDLTSARLYFERAAEAGDPHAALLVGKTFDLRFLVRAGIPGIQGDRQRALVWYRRAHELGEPDALRLLDKLSP